MKGSRLDMLRRVMQYGFLAAIAVVAVYPNLLPGMHSATILFLWLIAVGNLFFGKLFCSHLCPGGLLSEYTAKLKEKIFGSKWGIKRWSLPDNLLRSIKYILAIVLFHPKLGNTVPYPLVIALALISITVIGMFEKMFFCKYMCIFNATSNVIRFTIFLMVAVAAQLILNDFEISFPVVETAFLCGYFLEIHFKKTEYNISLLHIHRDIHKCRECGNCSTACPYSVEIKKAKRVVDVDCNLCGDCVRKCPNDALKVGICNTRPDQNRIRGVWFAPLITLVLLAIAVLFYIQILY